MTEEPFVAGRSNAGEVVRVGDTIHRPSGPWTANVHTFLLHVRRGGFSGCPEPLGFDDQGREILTYVAGRVIVDPEWNGGPTWWPEDVRSDETLAERFDASAAP